MVTRDTGRLNVQNVGSGEWSGYRGLCRRKEVSGQESGYVFVCPATVSQAGDRERAYEGSAYLVRRRQGNFSGSCDI